VQGYQFNWAILLQYRQALQDALLLSVSMWGAALGCGLALGLALAYLSQSRHRALRLFASGYVAVARNTPLLLLVFIAYLVLPQYGWRGLSAQATFVLALSVIAAGYLAENFRAAFETVPKSYRDAARAIGLTALQRELYVVLPIAIRYALPSLVNSAVAIFKDTSLASIIAIHELTYVAREITTNTFRVFESWSAVALIYLAVTTLMALAAGLVERRLPRMS
jgi:polar amino acid transport system permease protein